MRKKAIFWSLFLAALYVAICLYMYLYQEKYIFNSRKLDPNYKFQYGVNHEELYFESSDGVEIHGVLFKSDSARGLIFFLHGSGGNISWYKKSIPVYTGLNYDIFLLDYRGYGKSKGKITNEDQLHMDVKSAYELMKSKYNEDQIVIIGSSMGTVLASKLASENSPKALILEGTIYSAQEKAKKKLPFLPVSLIARYQLAIKDYIPNIDAPIRIFHGDKDTHNDVSNSLRLKPILKPIDKIIILKGKGHQDFAEFNEYIVELRKILN